MDDVKVACGLILTILHLSCLYDNHRNHVVILPTVAAMLWKHIYPVFPCGMVPSMHTGVAVTVGTSITVLFMSFMAKRFAS